MSATPAFELFEALCRELATRSPAVIADNRFESSLIDS